MGKNRSFNAGSVLTENDETVADEVTEEAFDADFEYSDDADNTGSESTDDESSQDDESSDDDDNDDEATPVVETKLSVAQRTAAAQAAWDGLVSVDFDDTENDDQRVTLVISTLAATPKPRALLDQFIGGSMEAVMASSDPAATMQRMIATKATIQAALPTTSGPTTQKLDPRDQAKVVVLRYNRALELIDAATTRLNAEYDKAVAVLGEDDASEIGVSSESPVKGVADGFDKLVAFVSGVSTGGKGGGKSGNADPKGIDISEFVDGARFVKNNHVLVIEGGVWTVDGEVCENNTPTGAATYALRKDGKKDPSVNGKIWWKRG